jgi:hypothetical protein
MGQISTIFWFENLKARDQVVGQDVDKDYY